MTCNQLILLAAAYRGTLEEQRDISPATYESDLRYLSRRNMVLGGKITADGYRVLGAVLELTS